MKQASAHHQWPSQLCRPRALIRPLQRPSPACPYRRDAPAMRQYPHATNPSPRLLPTRGQPLPRSRMPPGQLRSVRGSPSPPSAHASNGPSQRYGPHDLPVPSQHLLRPRAPSLPTQLSSACSTSLPFRVILTQSTRSLNAHSSDPYPRTTRGAKAAGRRASPARAHAAATWLGLHATQASHAFGWHKAHHPHLCIATARAISTRRTPRFPSAPHRTSVAS